MTTGARAVEGMLTPRHEVGGSREERGGDVSTTTSEFGDSGS